uniref:Tyrosine-protein phosphatase domain-containing protein n=1 Tax=Globodera pallida TaxID=36090 RepID=A0A183CPY9_GLOPA
AANVCIDQMEMDHEVDVFHAVKMIRLNRPQLIDMKDEYKYLYDLMLHWYMTSPELRQFEPPEMSVVSDAEEEASDGDASLGGGAPLMTRSQGGSTRRRPGSIRHDGQSLARSNSASRPSPLLEGEKVGHVHGQPGSDLIGDEHQQQQQLVVDEEENELLGVRRKTSRLRAAVRPLSTSALPDPPCTPTMPTAPGGMPIRKKSSGGVQMLFRGGSDQRTKRDSRGRRLGGEWDKRLERRGDDVVALFDERGVGAASGTREREQLDNDDAATMAHAETGTTTTGYMSTLRRSTVTTTAARRRRLSRRRKRRERRMARTFSQPNLGTLERFEKVSA